jgi:hypothetical protein
MATPGTLTPLDYVLDICLLQLPKLLTVETMVQYQLPLVPPFFVDSVWRPVFSWLLTRDMIMGAPDLRAHFLASLDGHVRNLRTLAIAYDEVPNPTLRAEQGLYEQIAAGLMARTQPPTPNTNWEDVVHMLSTCADLASHVRLFASLGHCVASKAVLLGEMLGVACSEHRGLLSREAEVVFKSGFPLCCNDDWGIPDARVGSPAGPVPGPVFGPCVGWDLRGADGGYPGLFNGRQRINGGDQSDKREWAAAVGGDPCIEWGARSARPPIAPPPAAFEPRARAAVEQKQRESSKPRRRRLREGEDPVEARLPPASRRGPPRCPQ